MPAFNLMTAWLIFLHKDSWKLLNPCGHLDSLPILDQDRSCLDAQIFWNSPSKGCKFYHLSLWNCRSAIRPRPHSSAGVKGRILTLLLCPTARGKGCDTNPDPHIWSCNPKQGTHSLLHSLTREHTFVTPLIALVFLLFLGPLDKRIVILIMFYHPRSVPALEGKSGMRRSETSAAAVFAAPETEGENKLFESCDRALDSHCSRTTPSSKLYLGTNWKKPLHNPPEDKGRTKGRVYFLLWAAGFCPQPVSPV